MAAPEPRIAIVGGAGALATEALAWMLTKSGNRVVGAYPSCRELRTVSRAGELNLQAAIVYTDDLETGPEAVAEIKRAHPELKILLLCEVATAAVVRCAIDEQAEGVVLTSDTVEEMILALHHVLEGRAVMPVGWQAASLQQDAPLATLSAREREILDLLTSGLSNKEIATHLTISSNTVKFHLRTIYSKLGVCNRVQAMQAVGGTAAVGRGQQEDPSEGSNTAEGDQPVVRSDHLPAS
ncbi:MAG: LuxR C-terminal-related transcriptional regulator [Solirubrobacterales bacterium]